MGSLVRAQEGELITKRAANRGLLCLKKNTIGPCPDASGQAQEGERCSKKAGNCRPFYFSEFSIMHFVYILYSEKANKYYVGETANVDQRLIWHNTHYFKSASTVITSDWKVFLTIQCEDIKQARKIEMFIKKMKSRVFIEKLKQADHNWLLQKFR